MIKNLANSENKPKQNYNFDHVFDSAQFNIFI